MTADLHIHTTASDGRFSPEEIVEAAVNAGLSDIAITDHDTVAGVLELYTNKKSTGRLNIIPGIEFSTDLPNYEVHILGLNIDVFNSELSGHLIKLVNDRQERAKRMIDKINKHGYGIEYQRVVELSGGALAIGRPHIARALVEKGHFTEISEVFKGLLNKGGPFYIPHYKMDIKTVIQVIKEAGGAAILAHPGLIGSKTIVKEIIAAGIDGLEAYYPMHSSKETDSYLALAKQENLLVTGGSDFHAIPGRYPETLGEFTVPTHIVHKLCNNTAIK